MERDREKKEKPRRGAARNRKPSLTRIAWQASASAEPWECSAVGSWAVWASRDRRSSCEPEGWSIGTGCIWKPFALSDEK